MSDKTTEQPSARATNESDIAASQLSALVDDELNEMEIDLVLRRLCREDDLQASWSRYHLISDVIQGHLPDMFDSGFSARIRQAIEDEPLPQPISKPLPAWYKPVTGFGLAASVVLVTMFGLKLTQTEEASPVPIAQQVADNSSGSSFTPRIVQPIAAVQQMDSASEPIDARLNSYLVNHNGYASLNSMHGMLPYVRMVGYQQAGR